MTNFSHLAATSLAAFLATASLTEPAGACGAKAPTAQSIGLVRCPGVALPNSVITQPNTVEVKRNGLIFGNDLEMGFRRTVRLERQFDANGREIAQKLPAPTGVFSLRDVQSLPGADQTMRDAGGVVMPAHNNDGIYINLRTLSGKPVLVKVYVGGVNAVEVDRVVTRPDLSIDPSRQDYMVVGGNINPSTLKREPGQPWIDGVNIGKDPRTGRSVVRQFYATTDTEEVVEKQMRGEIKMGGIQVIVIPMDDDFYQNVYLPGIRKQANTRLLESTTRGIGIGAGATIEQKIYPDMITLGFDPSKVWDVSKAKAIKIQTVPASMWPRLTGGEPMPHRPFTMADYEAQGLPFFKLDDGPAGSVAAGSKAGKIKPGADQKPKSPVIIINPYDSGPKQWQ